MSFSNRLKTLRLQNNMTQQNLADAINVARTTITGYETKNRQPSHEKLTALADLFDVSIDFLIDPSDDSDEIIITLQQKRDIDKEIQTACSQLSYGSKEDVLKYMNYLQFCENEKKNSMT